MIMPAAAAPGTQTVLVPAYQLVKSKKNARKTGQGRNIPELANSILKQGLLQNLVVSQHRDTYPVEAGERRRLAIAYLVKKRKLPRDWPVPVRIVEAGDRTAASLAENFHRERMHPADEFDAFTDLATDGWTIDEIADAFGVTPLVVERRLTLARAAPALLTMFRADEITTQQLVALCSTDDHERQVAAWNNSPSWNRDPANLRRAVLTGEIDVTRDSRIAFIGGVDAFVAAGGEVRRDLFSGDGQGGFITDVGLLEQLVAQKLEATAAEVRGEGWGWVEVWPQWDWTEYNRLGHVRRTVKELSPEAAARLAALQAEHNELATEADGFAEDAYGDELPEPEAERYAAICTRMEEISGEISEINRAREGYDPEAVPAAGAVIGIDGGRLRIERGLVRASDRPKLTESGGGTHVVTGGRTSEPGGRKAGALSDALMRSLFGYRNLAAQTSTAGNPHVAKVLLACWTVQTLRQRNHNVPLDLRITEMGFGTRTGHAIADEGGEAKRAAFDSIGAGLIASLPTEDDALWDALMLLPAEDLDKLIGFAVASAVSLNRKHTGLTARLLAALGFDMADHFTPTAGNYLSRVSKAQIVDALTEAGKVTSEVQRSGLASLKKADLAARAEAELANSRWVPDLIRTPTPAPPTAAGKKPRDRRAKRGRRDAGEASPKRSTGAPGKSAAGAAKRTKQRTGRQAPREASTGKRAGARPDGAKRPRKPSAPDAPGREAAASPKHATPPVATGPAAGGEKAEAAAELQLSDGAPEHLERLAA
jgi:ParB family chromosome partitioning protein